MRALFFCAISPHFAHYCTLFACLCVCVRVCVSLSRPSSLFLCLLLSMQIDLTPVSFMHFCRVFGGKLLVRSCVIIYKQQTYTFDAQLRWYMVAACWVHPVTSVSLRGHYERGAFLVQERIFLSFLPNRHSIPFFRFAVLSRTSFTLARSLAFSFETVWSSKRVHTFYPFLSVLF